MAIIYHGWFYEPLVIRCATERWTTIFDLTGERPDSTVYVLGLCLMWSLDINVQY